MSLHVVLFCTAVSSAPSLSCLIQFRRDGLGLTFPLLIHTRAHMLMHTHSLLIKASSVANCSAAVGFLSKRDILIKRQPGNTVIKYECDKELSVGLSDNPINNTGEFYVK